MRRAALLLVLLLSASAASAQTFATGARVQAGPEGVLVRVSPSSTALCLPAPAHACVGGIGADSQAPGSAATVLADAPVLEGATLWYRLAFDNGLTGWSKAQFLAAVPQALRALQAFSVVADYSGPVLTGAHCLLDGIAVAATLELQRGPDTAAGATHVGTVRCAYPSGTTAGNHIAVVVATNPNGSTRSTELQFTAQAAQPAPAAPTAPRLVL